MPQCSTTFFSLSRADSFFCSLALHQSQVDTPSCLYAASNRILGPVLGTALKLDNALQLRCILKNHATARLVCLHCTTAANSLCGREFSEAIRSNSLGVDFPMTLPLMPNVSPKRIALKVARI